LKTQIQSYSVIGLMSGTSFDGLDIAFCRFFTDNKKWNYELMLAETVPYPALWQERLSSLEHATALEFVTADTEYGFYLGNLTNDFIRRNKIVPHFIASHGHTIFHRPEKKFSCQIGKGSAIAAVTGLPVICDFRSLDVNLGGQGAPLVPVGDRLLFADFDFCLNLGGFANISFEKKGKRVAFDLCPVNTVLNRLAGKAGLPFDEEGRIARSGKTDERLLAKLDGLDYYSKDAPKSLGREWLDSTFYPALEHGSLSVQDLMRTVCEHIVMQVSRVLPDDPSKKMLVTGGGAFNSFLVECIRNKIKIRLVVPDPDTVNFKEALIFAFLGVLRWREEINCLASVTGASADSCGGAIYYADSVISP
jgi:anhydro-N-acetylmuramic acid kinase